MRTRLSHAEFFGLTLAIFLLPAGDLLALAQTPVIAPQSQVKSQAPAPQGSEVSASDKPLPEINLLMQQVETHQKDALKINQDYTYRTAITMQTSDSHGNIKKTRTEASENFWVNGAHISRVLLRDDKPLSADELKKQNDRIDKQIASAKVRNSSPTATQTRPKRKGDDEITFAQFLELGAFSGERRVSFNGRDTIAVDYAGNPKAKAHNMPEEMLRNLAGTAWIDEQDHILSRVEGHFVNSFKIGGGIVASIQKNTHFTMEQVKVNDEVWLPARFEGQGSMHVLLFFGFNGGMQAVNSDYRKFRTKSTILPNEASTSQAAPSTVLPALPTANQ